MTDTSNLPATQGGMPEMPEGLEDFSLSDAVIPALRLDHKKGKIVDTLSGAEFPELTLILLGLIKQRVLWRPEVQEEKERPWCRSYNFTEGHPNPELFPWEAAKLDNPGEEAPTLPCASCNLKEWGSHPNREVPWCSEQHTYAVMRQVSDDGAMAPAIFTVQRSALKPSNTYLTSFSQAREPLYVCFTRITLDIRTRGNVDFAIPKFSRGEATPQDEWAWYSQNYRTIRDFVQTPRSRDEEEEVESVVNEPGTEGAASGEQPAASAPVDDDDLPF